MSLFSSLILQDYNPHQSLTLHLSSYTTLFTVFEKWRNTNTSSKSQMVKIWSTLDVQRRRSRPPQRNKHLERSQPQQAVKTPPLRRTSTFTSLALFSHHWTSEHTKTREWVNMWRCFKASGLDPGQQTMFRILLPQPCSHLHFLLLLT